MANADYSEFFKGGKTNFETVGRSITVAEARTQTIEAYGKYADLMDLKLKPGDGIPSFVSGGTVQFGSLYIRDYNIVREEGEMAKLVMNCVEASSKTSPYNVTVDIDLAQVEKKLINHPLLKSVATQRQIRLFENTEANLQYAADGTPQSAFNLDTGEALESPVALDDEGAIAYAKAKLLGVDSYSIYLPVITRTSQYLSLPGVHVDATTMEASGTAHPDGIEGIGDFDTPPISVYGFTDGIWFKNGDKFQQNANGSWTRTEVWTYSNDMRLKWIYENGAAHEVVQED